MTLAGEGCIDQRCVPQPEVMGAEMVNAEDHCQMF